MIKPNIFSPFPEIAAGMSTRHGGVSQASYASMNLDNRGPDDDALRQENRRIFCNALGFEEQELVRSLQTHETELLNARQGGLFEGYDAIVTHRERLLLAVSVADCAPILIFDRRNRVVAAVHAGWRGTVAGIVSETLQYMGEQYDTRGRDCYAYIGPCIDECSFEVGEEVAEQFDPAFKQWNTEKGKFYVDLKKANAAQLREFEIPEGHIEISPLSTFSQCEDFFSYRAENGITGRMLAAIGILHQ